MSIQSTLEFFNHKEHGITEIRIPNAGKYRTVSGYFDDYSRVENAITQYNGKFNIYFTLNPAKRSLLARASNRIKTYAQHTTADGEIACCIWLPIDIDPVRPAGISSTDEELQLALECRDQISEMLGNLGIQTISGMSGNGGHLLIYHKPHPPTQEFSNLRQEILKTIKAIFNSDKIKVDETVYNPARIWKLYGTMATKGDNIPNRPYRQAVIEIPVGMNGRSPLLSPIDIQDLHRLIVPEKRKDSPKDKSKRQTSSDYPDLDLDAYLSYYSVPTKRKKDAAYATIWELEQCPFHPEHARGEAIVMKFPSGALAFKCHHDSCANYGWQEFKEKVGDPKDFYLGTSKTQKTTQDTTQEHKRYWTTDPTIRPPKPTLDTVDELPMPQLPESVWIGHFDTYRKVMDNATEAPNEYHFGCFQNIIGLAAGRGTYFQSAQMIRPNFYTCLIGPTGKTRKTTAMKLAYRLLPNVECGIEITQRCATPEGMLFLMKEKNDYHPKVLVTLSELATLMSRANSKVGAGLIEVITELFDRHEKYRHPTLTNPIIVEEPFLSIMSGSTQDWLERSFSMKEVLGGFSNRWLFFVGKPKDPIPQPERVDTHPDYQTLTNFISSLALYDPMGEVKRGDEATKLWNEFYIDFQKREWLNETIASMVQRVPDYVTKSALVFSIVKNSREIDAESMRAAIDLGQYLIQTIHFIFRLFGSDKRSLHEAKIRAKILELGGECTRRELARRLSSSISGQELNWALEAMAANDEVALWVDDTEDRYPKKMVTLLTE